MTRQFSKLSERICFRAGIVVVISAIVVLSASKLVDRSGPGPESPMELFTDYLGTEIPDLMAYYRIPGLSTAIIRGGNIAWTEAYGLADVEQNKKMTVDAVCRVESISKAVTAWGIMKLAEQGSIDLDAPVGKYIQSISLPESEYSWDMVTVRRLLSGNAGLPLPFETLGVRYPPGTENIPSLESQIKQYAVPMKEPGSGFYYSNAGYWLLELLIEEVTGRDFAEYMGTEILAPLGMDEASFNWTPRYRGRVPNGYTGRNVPIPPYIYSDQGAGGLFATAEDIAAFLSAGMTGFHSGEGAVLSDHSINAIYSEAAKTTGYYGIVFDAYGLGHFIENLKTGEKAAAVGGQGSGWMCHFHSIPETGDGIVLLTNSQNSWPFFGHLLSDWAHWVGISKMGMGIINTGQIFLWIVIGLILAVTLFFVWKIGPAIVSGERRFAPLKREKAVSRGAVFFCFLAITVFLVWVFTRNYFFINSTFPIASGWLWSVLIFFDVILFVSVLFPARCHTKRAMS